jgi:hypothetical protein
MAELALDDDQRNAFVGHLDGVGVTQLMRGKATPHAGAGSGATQIGAGRGVRPVPSARRSGDDAEQRADREPDARLEPRVQLLPAPRIHADLAPSSSLPLANE